MLTLEAEHPIHTSNVVRHSINIVNMLDIALQFMPFEEAEVLDQIQLLLSNAVEE